jgi:hypothetical protein
MNQTIRESGALLACMRQRAEGYNTQARRSAGLPVERQPRYQVLALGKQFQVIERTTGIVRSKGTGYSDACTAADKMESLALAAERRSEAVKAFGRKLTKWSLVASAVLVMFAYFGAHPGGAL